MRKFCYRRVYLLNFMRTTMIKPNKPFFVSFFYAHQKTFSCARAPAVFARTFSAGFLEGS